PQLRQNGGDMRVPTTAIVAFALLGADAFADPVGQYSVSGFNPGNTTAIYNGTVTVKRTGDTYQVIWVIAGTRFVGTGIGSEDYLAVSLRSKNSSGLGLYASQKDGSWTGVSAFDGGTVIGTEKWTP